MENDLALLRRYADRREAEAFEELVRRHAGMVYGSCRRIVGDATLAEDISQECFLKLARESGAIRVSLPAWLHRTAVNQALTVLREEARRHRREALSAKPLDVLPPREPTWEELGPHVDEALASLPDELREPLVLFFLEQKTKESIAEELGVHGTTVARRVDRGVELLRDQLRKAGYMVPAALLITLVTQNATQAAPATLAVTLGKVAMSGFAGHATAASAGSAASTAITTVSGGITMGMGVKLMAGALIVSAAVVGVMAVNKQSKPVAKPQEPAPAVVSEQPVLPEAPVVPAVAPAPAFDREALIADLINKIGRLKSDSEAVARLRAEDDESLRALLDFYNACKLNPDENVKLMAPPFLPGRIVYYRVATSPRQVQAIPRGPDFNWLRWEDSVLQQNGMTFGRSRLIDAAARQITERYGRQYVEGDAGMLATRFPGDMVFSQQAGPEALASGLERALNEQGLGVRIYFKDVLRNVLVCEGTFSLKPLPDYEGSFVIYGTEPRADPRRGGGAAGDIQTALDYIGNFIGEPVVAGDISNLPLRRLQWKLGPRKSPQSLEPLDAQEQEVVLQHVTEQTGLTFRREERPVRILFVERALEKPALPQ